MNTLGTLLSGLIDYAGLFPPASLSMDDATGKYSIYLQGNENWALGRFILPAARFSEFGDAYGRLASRHTHPWRISLLGGPEEAWRALEEYANSTTLALLDTLEDKADSPQAIESKAKQIPEGMTAYFEVPFGRELPELLAACAATGCRAKFRTGGVMASMIPRAEELARALCLCCSAGVPFKATAGLHHPIRSPHRLTYEPDAPTGTMHGFLNVFLAAALLWAGGSESDAAITLRKDSPEAFDFGENQVYWHAYTLSQAQLQAAREQFAISFGSCSFEEPIEDLRRLSWL